MQQLHLSQSPLSLFDEVLSGLVNASSASSEPRWSRIQDPLAVSASSQATNLRPTPAFDITEFTTGFVLEADLPGVKAEDLSMEFDDGMLIIKGSRAPDSNRLGRSEKDQQTQTTKEDLSVAAENTRKAEDTGLHVHLQQRWQGSFKRQFQLPKLIDSQAIEAELQNGVLRLWVPKAEAAKPRLIPIRS